MDARTTLLSNIKSSIQIKQQFTECVDQIFEFEAAAKAVLQCYQDEGRLYIAGNGGSAADAQHLATEFVSRLARDRAPLPAEALTVDSSVLTAIGNDYGFDQIFARQLLGKATKRDIFLGITTSGKSKNIFAAFEACRKMKIPSILLSSNDGGICADIATFKILAPKGTTAAVQELHLVIEHSLCQFVENNIFFNIK